MLAAACAGLVACGGQAVIDGDAGDGGNGGNGQAGNGQGNTGNNSQGGNGQGGDTPIAFDGVVVGDAVVRIVVSSERPTCGDPTLPDSGLCPHWGFEVQMPRALFVTGLVDFDDRAVSGFAQEAEPGQGMGGCGFGGGTFLGELNIRDIAATDATLEVSNAVFTPNSTFQVQICP